jgi:hypothetical protein
MMARRAVTDHWFISVEVPKLQRVTQLARQIKTVPTEGEAKQYWNKIVAGTLLSEYQPVRRIISGSELFRWIEEREK